MREIAILAGATGLVGTRVLTLLLDSARYRRVVTVGRRPTGRQDAGLEELEVDFAQLHLPEDLVVDDVYCCLGTTLKAAGSQEAFRRVDHDAVVALAEATLARGARRFFLVSALGANPSSRSFYSRVKGEAEDSVAKLGFQAVHIARPSLLLGERRERRPVEAIGQWLGRLAAPLFIGPLAPYRAVPAQRVARQLIDCADSDLTGVHIHYPT